MISAVSSGAASLVPAPDAASKPQTSQASVPNTSPPAVILTIAKPAATSGVIEPVSEQVSDQLSHISGLNTLIDLFNHTDWNGCASRTSWADVNTQRLAMLQALKGGEISIAAESARLGLPAQVSILPNGGSKSGFTPISVDAFSFSDSGSTYQVTPSANGTLVGTKDGQAWNAWAIEGRSTTLPDSSGADVALQTLASAEKPSATGTTSLAPQPTRINLAI